MKGDILFCVLFAIFQRSIHSSQIGISTSSNLVEECGAKVIETIFGQEPVYFLYYKNMNHLLPFHVSNPKILVNTKDMWSRLSSLNNFVIQAANLSIFEESMEFLKLVQSNVGNGRFLVITNHRNLAKPVFKWYWKNNIVYVAVLTIDAKNRTKSLLFTGDPNDALNDCGRKLNVINSQSCTGSFTNTIPKATRNYNGCPATVGIPIKSRYEFDPRPYTLNVIQTVLNISFVLVDVSTPFLNMPEIMSDLPLTIYTFQNGRISHVYARDNVVFVVPPADKISYIEVLIVAFKKEVWVSILLTFVLFATAWYVICRFKARFSTIIVNTISITLSGSSNYIPNSSTARFLIMCYIIYSVHIQTAYVAELMRLLMSLPTEKHIESLDELLGTNLQIQIDVESTLMFHTFQFNKSKFRGLEKRILGNGDPHNLTESWYANKHFSFSILLKTLQSIELKLKVSPPPYFVENEHFTTITNVFLSEKSAFIDSMDEIIDRLTESGFYDKLDQDRKFDAEEKKSQFISEEEVVAFSFEHLSGVFVVFGCGLLLSTLTFFGELIVHRFTM